MASINFTAFVVLKVLKVWNIDFIENVMKQSEP